MKPVKFKGVNTVYAEDQDEYLYLPAQNIDGIVKTCWKMTFVQRFYVLFTGCVWLEVMTFGSPLQPIRVKATQKEN